MDRELKDALVMVAACFALMIALVALTVLLSGCFGTPDEGPEPKKVCADHGGLVEVGESGVIACVDGYSRKP